MYLTTESVTYNNIFCWVNGYVPRFALVGIQYLISFHIYRSASLTASTKAN
jgi:hypothetical protein